MHSADCQTAKVRRCIQVGDVGLKWCALGVLGSRHCGEKCLEQWLKVFFFWHAAICWANQRSAASLGTGVNDGEFDLLFSCIEIEEEFVGLVNYCRDAGVGTVNLINNKNYRKVFLKCLAQYETGLRKWTFRCVYEEHNTVDHFQTALNFATEVSVTWGVNDVERDTTLRCACAGVVHRRVLGEDRDALFALEVHGVHDTLIDVLVLAEGTRLPQHGIHKRGFAVVDVGDNGYVTKIFSAWHPATLRGQHPKRRIVTLCPNTS
ncbi:unannotated protein [freshwater metagenome]|uniref:Unannotated protein n=1 Tax=freshwater metagenome TaxID=449393 RepID=A0A6J7SS89_9ZZZZ